MKKYRASWLGEDTMLASESLVLPYAIWSPLELSGLSTSYVYGDGPLELSTLGGAGTGDVALTSSNPAVASLSGLSSVGAGTLTLNRAGDFKITQTKAADENFPESSLTSPMVTVTEATPLAVLSRSGGTALVEPVSLTLDVKKRGSGDTPEGEVQFSLNGTNLGGPLPLVDKGNGTASVTLNGIPLQNIGAQQVTATFLGEDGKYLSVTKSNAWTLFDGDYCLALMP